MKKDHRSQRRTFKLLSLLLLSFFFALPGLCQAFEIEIDASPNTINLQSRGKVCTIHTDIDFGDVDVSTVYLNGIAINTWKSDDRGYFVAKFIIDDVKALPLSIDEYNTLQLVGVDMDGDAFSGSQDIMVISVTPNGGGK